MMNSGLPSLVQARGNVLKVINNELCGKNYIKKSASAVPSLNND
jgi:hypothetical protein